MIISISGKIKSGKDAVAQMIQYLSLKKDYPNIWGNKTFDDFLNKDHSWVSNWKIKKFAFKVKEVASILTGIPVENFEKQEVKDQVVGEQWWYYDGYQFNTNRKIPYNHTESIIADEFLVQPTYRQLLQHIGTEAIRDQIHPNAWVNALFADYNKLIKDWDTGRGILRETSYPNWIITDTRFPNEVKAVKERGGITIRINRRYTTVVGVNGTPATFDESQFHPSETALDSYKDWNYTIDNDSDLESLLNKVKEIYNQIKQNK